MARYKLHSCTQGKFISIHIRQQIISGYSLNHHIDDQLNLSIFDIQYRDEDVILMAVSCDTRPYVTTIADFVSTMDQEMAPLFRELLLVCDDMEWIGKEMFSINGCILTSNASRRYATIYLIH